MTFSALLRLLVLLAWCLGGAATVRAATGWPWDAQPGITGEAQHAINAQLIRRAPFSGAPALAARVSHEGHWTFTNAAGETFTAGSEAEIKRAFDVLLPEAASRPPAFLLTGDSVFERRALLVQLPRSAELALGWGEETFKLDVTGAGQGSRYVAQVRPSLFVALTTATEFAEAIQLLRRPMERQRFRVLSLEPEGPRALARSPRLDAASARPEVDPIDPQFLAPSLGALKGQTAVIVGRTDGDVLAFKSRSGPERSLRLGALFAAAEAADADLIVLKSASAQQPGGRNWLWQRVEIKGLEQALGHATLADFFAALGSASNRLVIAIERPAPQRTSFELSQLPGKGVEAMSASRLGDAVSDAVTSLVGNVVHTGAIGSLRSAERQAELDRRLIPFVPSTAQWLFGMLLVLGLLGLPMSLKWWGRLWPRENAAEYASAFGYWAARAVRAAAYVLLFMPLSAVIAAPLAAGAAFSRLVKRRAPAAPQN